MTELNYQYLQNQTSYPKGRQILACAHLFGFKAFREDLLWTLPAPDPDGKQHCSFAGSFVPEFLGLWGRKLRIWSDGKLVFTMKK